MKTSQGEGPLRVHQVAAQSRRDVSLPCSSQQASSCVSQGCHHPRPTLAYLAVVFTHPFGAHIVQPILDLPMAALVGQQLGGTHLRQAGNQVAYLVVPPTILTPPLALDHHHLPYLLQGLMIEVTKDAEMVETTGGWCLTKPRAYCKLGSRSRPN